MCADVRLVWVQQEDFSSTVREMQWSFFKLWSFRSVIVLTKPIELVSLVISNLILLPSEAGK